MAHDVYSQGRQFSNKETLIEAIKMSCNKIEQTMIENLFKSIPKRLLQCIKKHGHFDNY